MASNVNSIAEIGSQDLPAKRTNGDHLRTVADKFKRNQKSANTNRTYAAQWRGFNDWCIKNQRESLPADPGTILAYVIDMYERGKTITTLNVSIAAIKDRHVSDRLIDPTIDVGVQDMLKGARRTMADEGLAERNVKPTATLEHIRKLASACGVNAPGVRNKALILVAFGGWLRKSDLLTMTAERIKWEADRAIVTLGRTKTDQSGKGQIVELPRITGPWADLCPYSALKAWLTLAGIVRGPVWLATYRGTVTDKPLRNTDYIYEMVMALAKKAGIPAAEIAPHRTFRATPITLAILAGGSMPEVMSKARHKSAQTTTKYFDETAAGQHKVSRSVYGEE